jgi:hypothetical protein
MNGFFVALFMKKRDATAHVENRPPGLERREAEDSEQLDQGQKRDSVDGKRCLEGSTPLEGEGEEDVSPVTHKKSRIEKSIKPSDSNKVEGNKQEDHRRLKEERVLLTTIPVTGMREEGEGRRRSHRSRHTDQVNERWKLVSKRLCF